MSKQSKRADAIEKLVRFAIVLATRERPMQSFDSNMLSDLAQKLRDSFNEESDDE